MKALLLTMTLAAAALLAACGQSTPNGQQPTTKDSAQTQQRKILYYRSQMNPAATSPVPMTDSMGMPYVPVYANTGGKTSPNRKSKQPTQRKILYYRSQMNPAATSPVPMQDSMGMPYVPVYAKAESNASVVKISPVIVDNLGVRTATVKRGTLPRIIRTVGYVSYDKSLTRRVRVRASGWIGKAPVKSVGEHLKKGDLLFTFYSPDLVTAEQEYITALASGRRSLIDASRERLVALGISGKQIAAIKRTHRPIHDLAYRARHVGVVEALDIRAGEHVTAKTKLMQIGNLSRVWVVAQVFERQANWVKVGDKAHLQLPSMPGKTLTGTVKFVYPNLNPKTRTLKVRLAFANPDLALKPNMYVDARILTAPRHSALSVPLESVIREGSGAHVIVALGGGRFEPHDVTLGIQSGNRIQILSGLKADERVVTSGEFLIDSEANLHAALQRLSSKPNGKQ